MGEVIDFTVEEIGKSKSTKGSDLVEIFLEPEQSSLRNAVLADLVDAVPVIGDISNIARIGRIMQDMNAFESGQQRRQMRLEMIIEARSLRDVFTAIDKSLEMLGDEAREFRRRHGPMQTIDAALGVIPGLGAVADIITPTNTITYLSTKAEK